MLWDYLRMWNAAQLIVFALVFGQGQSAIDDVFRQVQEEYDDTMKSVASGLGSNGSDVLLDAHLQSDWCRYRMKGSNRTLVKLHYDMVIDVETYKKAFRKDFTDDVDSCETHSVDGQAANRRKRIASESDESRWPLEIPYQIEEGFDAPGIRTIIKAMEHWSRYTCLHFVERTDQYDHIIFRPDEICLSDVGRIIGPQHILLNLQKCMTLPIILHEIGHAIGLYHEHTREDRDNNVTVHYKNIKTELHGQFDKIYDEYLDFTKPYDYHSIMHYGKNFFADPRNATTLEPTDKDYLNIIGEAKLLSFHDVQIVNAMYKCKEMCAHVECPKGAFVGKNCECFCQGPREKPVQRCINPKDVDCKIENFDVRNVEVLFNGILKSDGDVVPDGSSVLARCKGSHENIPINESHSVLDCKKGHLKGQMPGQCPGALYACPIVQFATTSGPFNYGYDVKCFDKYEMQTHLQAARFQCDWRGVWRSFVPRCIPKTCKVIYDNAKVKVQLMNGSSISPNSRISSGQKISMSCTQKGNVPDQLTLTCDHGIYSETGETTLPVCKLVTCGPPPLSGSVVYEPVNNSYVFKDTVVIQRCQGKLWFQGDQRLTCTADGTWNGTATCTPYCQHGTEKWEERQHKDLIKHTIRNITVESYQECLTYCKTYDRILCRAFAYGFDQGKRRCHVTYADPNRHRDIMLGDRQLWSVWIRNCT